MAQLTQEMKDLIGAQQCFVATVNPDGTPNIGPKRSTRVLDDEHLVFTEVTGNQTGAIPGERGWVFAGKRPSSLRFPGLASEIVGRGGGQPQQAAIFST